MHIYSWTKDAYALTLFIQTRQQIRIFLYIKLIVKLCGLLFREAVTKKYFWMTSYCFCFVWFGV